MNVLRWTAASTAMMLSLTMASATSIREELRDSKEMIVGQYSCVTYRSSGLDTYGALYLNGTPGLFLSGAEYGPMNVYADFEDGGLPVCEKFVQDAQARLDAAGCTFGHVHAFDPDQNNNFAIRSLQFVCSGPRDRMVDRLARLVELIVTSER